MLSAASGSEAKAGIPAITALFKDTNVEVRWRAASALENLGPEAKAAIPALMELLRDEDVRVRKATVSVLGSIGPEAKTTVPTVIELLKDNDESRSVRRCFGLGEDWPRREVPPSLPSRNCSRMRMNASDVPQPKHLDKINRILPTAPEGKTWKLVWHDEFDGKKLDETKWEVMPDAPRKGGWWSRKAVSLDGKGHLVISTLKEGDKFLDGCVRTKGKFEHSFGYYVARVQLQKQPGHWSAFWIMGDGVGKVGSGGRDGTEIDIYEKPWLDDRVQHTLHWDGYGKDHKSEGNVAKVPGVMEGWHTFGLWWKPDEYIFYVDGKETWRTKTGVCQVPEYIKLSDEIGNWAGDIKKAKLPDAFLVDYVRVYDVVEK